MVMPESAMIGRKRLPSIASVIQPIARPAVTILDDDTECFQSIADLVRGFVIAGRSLPFSLLEEIFDEGAGELRSRLTVLEIEAENLGRVSVEDSNGPGKPLIIIAFS